MVLGLYKNRPEHPITDAELVAKFNELEAQQLALTEQAAAAADKEAVQSATVLEIDAAKRQIEEAERSKEAALLVIARAEADQAERLEAWAEAEALAIIASRRQEKLDTSAVDLLQIAKTADELSTLAKSTILDAAGEKILDDQVCKLAQNILEIAYGSQARTSREFTPPPSNPIGPEIIASTPPLALPRQRTTPTVDPPAITAPPSSRAPQRPPRTTERTSTVPIPDVSATVQNVEPVASAKAAIAQLETSKKRKIAKIIEKQSDPGVVKNALQMVGRVLAVLEARGVERGIVNSNLREPLKGITLSDRAGRAVVGALIIGGLSATVATVDSNTPGGRAQPKTSVFFSLGGHPEKVSLVSIIDPPHTVAAEHSAADVLSQWAQSLKQNIADKPPLSETHHDPETRQLLSFIATATQLRQDRAAANLSAPVAKYGQTQIDILKMVALYPEVFSSDELKVLATTDNDFQTAEAANLKTAVFHGTKLDQLQVSALLGVMAKWEDAVTTPDQKQVLAAASSKAAQAVLQNPQSVTTAGTQGPTALPSAPGNLSPKTTPPPTLPAIPPRSPNGSPSPAPEVGSHGEFDPNKYKGISFTHEDLLRLATNWPVYTEAEQLTGIPREFLATLHKREHNLEMSNPNNGQGVYQFFAEAGNYHPGPISQDEFRRQTILAAERIRDDYAKRGMKDVSLNDEHIDAQKVMDTFLRYNGAPDLYIKQAIDQGYSVRQAFMGSPYVVNLLTDKQDSSKNPHWLQYLSDGTNVGPANQQPGAWIIFDELLKADGNVSKLTNEIDVPPAPNPVFTAPPVVAPPTPAPAPSPSETPSPQPSAETSSSPEGTTDLGLATCYFSRILPDGSKEYFNKPTRLVAIKGFLSTSEESNPTSKFYVQGANGNVIVNADIVAQTKAMYDAAEADGIDLSAVSSYRSHDHQAELAKANSNRDEVAAAGESIHEGGLAIDLNLGLPLVASNFTTANGQTATEFNPRVAVGNKVWEWMDKNAERFGFKQYWNEPWHWQIILRSVQAPQPVHGAE